MTTTPKERNMTARDTEILRAELADKIDALRPLTQLGLDWQTTFEREAARWRAVGNGRRDGSDEQRDAYGWSTAHQLLLDEARS